MVKLGCHRPFSNPSASQTCVPLPCLAPPAAITLAMNFVGGRDMRLPPVIACALALGGPVRSATAAWLGCEAEGTDARGAFAAVTAIVDVGQAGPPQIQAFQRRLIDYTGKASPGATGVQAICSASNDQTEAATRYDHALTRSTRKLGWGRVTVVPPSAWLSESDIKSDTNGL